MKGEKQMVKGWLADEIIHWLNSKMANKIIKKTEGMTDRWVGGRTD